MFRQQTLFLCDFGGGAGRGGRGRNTNDAKCLERAPSIPSVSHIKNKMKRAEVLAKLRRAHFKTQLAKRKRQKEEREELRKQGIEPPRKVPRTIENTRVRDERTVARDDVETLQDEAVDELSTYFAGKQPKILITTNTHPSKVSRRFMITVQ